MPSISSLPGVSGSLEKIIAQLGSIHGLQTKITAGAAGLTKAFGGGAPAGGGGLPGSTGSSIPAPSGVGIPSGTFSTPTPGGPLSGAPTSSSNAGGPLGASSRTLTVATAAGAAVWNVAPNPQNVMTNAATFYGIGIGTTGYNSVNFQRQVQSQMGINGQTSSSGAMQAAFEISKYGTGANQALFGQQMSDVGMLGRNIGMNNQSAAGAVSALGTGTFISKARRYGIDLSGPGGTPLSTNQDMTKIYNRLFQDNGMSESDLRDQIRAGTVGRDLREGLGMSEDQVKVFTDYAVNRVNTGSKTMENMKGAETDPNIRAGSNKVAASEAAKGTSAQDSMIAGFAKAADVIAAVNASYANMLPQLRDATEYLKAMHSGLSTSPTTGGLGSILSAGASALGAGTVAKWAAGKILPAAARLIPAAARLIPGLGAGGAAATGAGAAAATGEGAAATGAGAAAATGGLAAAAPAVAVAAGALLGVSQIQDGWSKQKNGAALFNWSPQGALFENFSPLHWLGRGAGALGQLVSGGASNTSQGGYAGGYGGGTPGAESLEGRGAGGATMPSTSMGSSAYSGGGSSSSPIPTAMSAFSGITGGAISSGYDESSALKDFSLAPTTSSVATTYLTRLKENAASGSAGAGYGQPTSGGTGSTGGASGDSGMGSAPISKRENFTVKRGKWQNISDKLDTKSNIRYEVQILINGINVGAIRGDKPAYAETRWVRLGWNYDPKTGDRQNIGGQDITAHLSEGLEIGNPRPDKSWPKIVFRGGGPIQAQIFIPGSGDISIGCAVCKAEPWGWATSQPGAGSSPGEEDGTGTQPGSGSGSPATSWKNLLLDGKGIPAINNGFWNANKRYATGHHTGTDFGGRQGQSINTPYAGKVIKAGMGADGRALGGFVEVAMSDGYFLAFSHLDSVGVEVGQNVSAGTEIGKMGHTGGSGKFGTHLHLEVRNPSGNGKWLGKKSNFTDPLIYMANRDRAGSSTGTTRSSGNLVYDALTKAGFKGDALQHAYQIVLRESGGKPSAVNPKPPDLSYGLFQINMIGGLGPSRRKQFGLRTNEELLDPNTNARVAWEMSKGGTSWSPWNGPSLANFVSPAAKAIAAAQRAAGSSPQTGDDPPPSSTGSQGGTKTLAWFQKMLGKTYNPLTKQGFGGACVKNIGYGFRGNGEFFPRGMDTGKEGADWLDKRNRLRHNQSAPAGAVLFWNNHAAISDGRGNALNNWDGAANTSNKISGMQRGGGGYRGWAYNTDLKGFSHGAWNVSKDQTANIHSGEMILSAEMAEIMRTSLREGMAGIKGGRTVNITLKIDNASDAEAVRFAKKCKSVWEEDNMLTDMARR